MSNPPRTMPEPRAQHTISVGAGMVPLVVGLFFVWGFITVLNDPLVAKLKGLFALDYTEAMLTQFAFFLGYFVFSVPAVIALNRLGYVRSIALGLAIMALGCLMFAPAAMTGIFAGFLAALFCVAAGITLLQVAANPFIAGLGSSATAPSRLTLAQAFNSLGTFIGPFVGALFLLQNGVGTPAGAASQSARIAEAEVVQRPFLVIAGVLILLSIVFWLLRNAPAPPTETQSTNPFTRRALGRPRLMLGVLAIFLYVGAEVSIGSGLINYLMQPSVIGAQAASLGASAAARLQALFGGSYAFNVPQVAGTLVSVYWGLAMVGRFAGSFLLARITPGKVLCGNALAALALALLSAASSGIAAAVSILAIGLANSIMFPTIFALALEGLEEETPNGSALLCMAIVGGALVPLAYGAVADRFGLSLALVVPVICYAAIAAYGWFTARRI
jgi:FHS family L-fucose permease-like MFS transporter